MVGEKLESTAIVGSANFFKGPGSENLGFRFQLNSLPSRVEAAIDNTGQMSGAMYQQNCKNIGGRKELWPEDHVCPSLVHRMKSLALLLVDYPGPGPSYLFGSISSPGSNVPHPVKPPPLSPGSYVVPERPVHATSHFVVIICAKVCLSHQTVISSIVETVSWFYLHPSEIAQYLSHHWFSMFIT